MTRSQTQSVGTTRAVLVHGRGDEQKGVIVSVTAQAELKKTMLAANEGEQDQDVVVVGPTKVDDRLIDHYTTNVAAMVNTLLSLMLIGPRRFSLSFSNTAAASSQDRHNTIRGYSADAAVFLAMVSAALQVPIRIGVLATGHLCSLVGVLGMVRALFAKFSAVAADPQTSLFLYPPTDNSLATLSPEEAARNEIERIRAMRHVESVVVSDVAELLQLSIDEHEAIIAGLNHHCPGFRIEGAENPLSTAANFFICRDQPRMEGILNRTLRNGEFETFQRVLRADLEAHAEDRSYPEGRGEGLWQCIRALSPTRRRQIEFPLVPTSLLCRVGVNATPSDEEDLRRLLDANFGNGCIQRAETEQASERDVIDTVDGVLQRIHPDALNEKFAGPIDEAIRTYRDGPLEVKSHIDFNDDQVGVIAHVAQHTGLLPLMSDELMGAESHRIYEAAFAGDGGIESAEREARFPSRGGLRFVHQRVGDQIRDELTTQYVRRCISEVVDPFDEDERTRFLRVLLERIRDLLPAPLRERPVTDFVNDIDTLLRAYAAACGNLAQTLRRV